MKRLMIPIQRWVDNMLEILNAFNGLISQLNKLMDREDVKEKLDGNGIKGKLEIEDLEVFFLVRRKNEEEKE